VLTFSRQIQSERILRNVIASYSGDMHDRSDLYRLIEDAFATRALAYRHLKTYSTGALPGPEGSIDKLLWSEFFQRLTAFGVRKQGVRGICQSPDIERYLYSRGRTIAAGSSEIQRNIIADRILQLPKEAGEQRRS
ncbi:MAG: hypothetical protein KDD60_11565, partial [Bdellovibrionales bacterium]|nr:hypothetical protein [Bdellovibrionales bacterium]